jgi:AraC family transcriptional regulator
VHSYAQLAGGNSPEVRFPPDAWLSDKAFRAREEAEGVCERRRADVSPEQLLDDVRRTMVDDPASARSAALQLAMLLSAPPSSGATIVRGGLAPWQLRKIDRYLKENLAHSLRLRSLAEQVNLSVSHFNRSFKVSRGVTPHLHIVKLRLELAQSLMLTTDDPLCGIALACGLADQAHLTKLFRRHFGETPAAWRRRRFSEDGPQAAPGADVSGRLVGGVTGVRSSNFAAPHPKDGRERNSTAGAAMIDRMAARPLAIGSTPRVGALDEVF